MEMSKDEGRAYLGIMRWRYGAVRRKKGRGHVLDEFCWMTVPSRKHAGWPAFTDNLLREKFNIALGLEGVRVKHRTRQNLSSRRSYAQAQKIANLASCNMSRECFTEGCEGFDGRLIGNIGPSEQVVGLL